MIINNKIDNDMSIKNLSKVFQSKTPKPYKDKRLNNANFGDFNHGDYQVFLHLISKIGGVDEFGKYLQPEQLKRDYVLTAKEFSDVFNTDLSNSYKMLYKACKKLMKTSITLEKITLKETWEINICSMAKYNKDHGNIFIEFTDRIMPYIAQVREKFVLYNLKEIANFGSLYTTRLYEIIQEFKETGWVLKSIEQLRTIFAVGDKFKMYGHFKNKILTHACKEINDNYNMKLKFEEIKEGRKVVAVQFFFKPIVVTQVTNKKSGKITNIYGKPKTQATVGKKEIKKQQDVLSNPLNITEEQLSFGFIELEPEESTKGIFSSFFSKLRSSKK